MSLLYRLVSDPTPADEFWTDIVLAWGGSAAIAYWMLKPWAIVLWLILGVI